MGTDYPGYVDSGYLDVAAEILSAAKRRTYELMEVQAGHRVLIGGAEKAGLITDDQSRRFLADVEQAAEIGGFLASVQLVLVSGLKPDLTTKV